MKSEKILDLINYHEITIPNRSESYSPRFKFNLVSNDHLKQHTMKIEKLLEQTQRNLRNQKELDMGHRPQKSSHSRYELKKNNYPAESLNQNNSKCFSMVPHSPGSFQYPGSHSMPLNHNEFNFTNVSGHRLNFNKQYNMTLYKSASILSPYSSPSP